MSERLKSPGIALGASVSTAVLTFAGFWLSESASLLAMSLHLVVHSVVQTVLLVGSKRARWDGAEFRQFGFGREHYVGSFVVAIVAFLLGSLLVINGGLERIVNRSEHRLDRPWLAVAVAAVGLIIHGWSSRTAIGESNHLRGSATWSALIRRCPFPELSVVLVHQIAAIVGLVGALIGVALTGITGTVLWDGVGAVLIGTLMGVMVVMSTEQMKSLLIGESATVADQQQIVAAIESAPTVRSLVHMRTHHVGPEELLVAAKVEFEHNMSTVGLASSISGIEERIRSAVPGADPIYIEADVRSDW